MEIELNISDISLETVVERVLRLHSGEIFLVKDLFTGVIWKRIGMGKRRDLGRFFLDYARKHSELVEILEKNNANQQLYRKI